MSFFRGTTSMATTRSTSISLRQSVFDRRTLRYRGC
jgi:hypothetical protein